MKGLWIAASVVLSLASCERKGEARLEGSGGKGQDPATRREAKTGGGEAAPDGKAGDPPVLIEKKPPVAEPAPGQPGLVLSPYNGKLVDVKGFAPGTLVADPAFPLTEKKYFRVPEPPLAAGDPAKLLDPGILIRPIPPKDPGDVKEEKEEP